MLLFCLLVILKFSIVVALTLPPSQEIISTPSLNIQEESFEKVCNLKSENDVPHIMPWQEIPQRAMGCSVPYHGPQGHGQFPEEVHLVHITNVDGLVQSLSHQHQAMVSITVWLDAAFCENKTIPLQQHHMLLQNGSDPSSHNEEQGEAMKDISSILRFKSTSPSHSADLFASHDTQASPQPPMKLKSSKAPRPLVLVLTSDQPVIWQIKRGTCWREGITSGIQATVEKDSPVDSDILVEVVPRIWVKKINRKSIQRYARRTFHGVASFTQMRGANSLRIVVGPTDPSTRESSHLQSFRNRNKLNFCDFSSREESHLVSASLAVPVSAESCVFGAENTTNIFIIEIQSLPVQSSRELMHGKATPTLINPGNRPFMNLSKFVIHLSENKANFKAATPHEQTLGNVTVILRSQQRVHWSIYSLIEHTEINIITTEGDAVECNDCSDTVKLSSLLLPQSRLDLLHKVLTEYGQSVHYFSINYATGLTFSIDKPSNQVKQESQYETRQISSDMHLPPWSAKQEPSHHPPSNLGAGRKDIQSILESDMVILCGTSTFEIVVPAPLLMQQGVSFLYLKDQSCQSHNNGTHFILSSLLKSCGSSINTDGRSTIISNSVHIGFTSQNDNGVNTENLLRSRSHSNLGSTEGTPVACGTKPKIDEDVLRSIFNSRDDVTSEEDESVGNSSPNSGSSSIYQLELYRKDPSTSGTSPMKFRSLIDLNEQIYVRAWMDDAPTAQAVIESCWISNLPYSAMWLANQRIVLLNGMCPIGANVKLEKQSPHQTKSFLFTFQMSKDFLHLGQELYVHCQVGLCISSLKHSKGKPVLCEDPEEYCHLQDTLAPRTNSVSTAHQLLTRGPLRVRSDGPPILPGLPLETKCGGVVSSPHAPSIGMDTTVAIALGSFIIGIVLTATLWFIHIKTEPIHRGSHTRGHSLGSQSAVMGSSLSPHSACSSTNSQSAIAT